MCCVVLCAGSGAQVQKSAEQASGEASAQDQARRLLAYAIPALKQEEKELRAQLQQVQSMLETAKRDGYALKCEHPLVQTDSSSLA